MIKALWLTSWYPTRLDALNGDFIQRHARATSLFCQVHVIHFEPDRRNVLKQEVEVSIAKQPNLVEEIVLYKLSSLPLVGKFFSYRRYASIFKKHITAYIQRYGKPDIVHVHVPMKAGILALWLKKKYGLPYVVTEHWAIYNNTAPDAFRKRNFFFQRFTKKILQQASMFLPVSAALGKAVQQLVAPVPFTVVNNVVDTNLFKPNESKQPGQGFAFLHVSTLAPQKCPEGILRAFSKFISDYPVATLTMVGGENDIVQQLRQLAPALNIPSKNICFTGYITYAQVAATMQQSDALILFSRYENSPCVVGEALCCGLPVIAANVGGIAELLGETNGLLIPVQDETALLNAMVQLYKNSAFYNSGTIAKEAAHRFGYAEIGRQIAGVYDNVINQTSYPGK